MSVRSLTALSELWAKRSRGAHPSDAMVINMQIRELRETMAAWAPLNEYRDFIGFALWQAIQLPSTDPRRAYIQRANELLGLIDNAPPEDLAEFMRWCADELMRRDNSGGMFTPGIVMSLRGHSLVLDQVAKPKGSEQ